MVRGESERECYGMKQEECRALNLVLYSMEEQIDETKIPTSQ